MIIKQIIVAAIAVVAFMQGAIAQARIQLDTNCGTQQIIDHDHQLFFKLKGPDGVEHKVMVRIPATSSGKDMAINVSNAINTETGQSSTPEEPATGPDPDAYDVRLSDGWSFVRGCTWKYKKTDELQDNWLRKTSGHLQIKTMQPSEGGYTNEKPNETGAKEKPFKENPVDSW